MSRHRGRRGNPRVEVYTDGCCRNNGRQGARAGIGVFFPHYDDMDYSGPLEGDNPPTNNNAEIQAATKACEIARQNGFFKLRIFTDSQYLINCWELWLDKWLNNGWRNSKNKEVANRSELENLLDASFNMNIEFQFVPGHANVYGNEMAHKLANQGAEDYFY